ncbi:MAG: hypothetical protein IT438_01195 [Phycisphaerales bacterium]|nr:hypothetical protein [Phycisphaerales bacterium]
MSKPHQPTVSRKQIVLVATLGAAVAVVAAINFIDFSSPSPRDEAQEAARSLAEEMRAQVPPDQVDPAPPAQPSPSAPSPFGR